MQDFWSIPSFMAASVGDMMLCTPTRRCRPRVLAMREVLETLRRDGSLAAVSNRIASFAERQCLVRRGGLGRARGALRCATHVAPTSLLRSPITMPFRARRAANNSISFRRFRGDAVVSKLLRLLVLATALALSQPAEAQDVRIAIAIEPNALDPLYRP